MTRHGWLAVAVFAASCADLPPLEPGVCGNAVVDEDEDCDSLADPDLGPNTVCAAADDSTRACRYVCAQTTPCPIGWGCGPDGVCRYASGNYEEASGSPFGLRGDFFATGDADDDG